MGAACSNVALTEGCKLREESAFRSSDLRLLRLAAAPPTPTTFGREYGVSRGRDVQLKALRACQTHMTCQPHARRVRRTCACGSASTAGEGRACAEGCGLAALTASCSSSSQSARSGVVKSSGCYERDAFTPKRNQKKERRKTSTITDITCACRLHWPQKKRQKKKKKNKNTTPRQ